MNPETPFVRTSLEASKREGQVVAQVIARKDLGDFILVVYAGHRIAFTKVFGTKEEASAEMNPAANRVAHEERIRRAAAKKGLRVKSIQGGTVELEACE